MKNKIAAVLIFCFSLQSCGDGQIKKALPKYEEDFITSQNSFDKEQNETFTDVAKGDELTKSISQKTYPTDEEGRKERKNDLESVRSEWESIQGAVSELNGRFLDLGNKADAYFNETQNKLNSLPNDSDKNQLYYKFNQQRNSYLQKFKSAKRDLDELDKLVEQAKHFITKIEIAQSMQAISGIMGEFSNISLQISNIKTRLSAFSQDSKSLIHDGFKS